MPEMAKSIVLRQANGRCELLINGEPFPWHVARDPAPQVGPVVGDSIPTLTVTILADSLEVEHNLRRSESPSDAVATD